MAVRTIKVIMNGVTGRMGYRQHLVRSILPIRDDGGVVVGDDRVQVEPILVGRNDDKLAKLAELHEVADWTTDLDAVLADPEATIYFDAQVTSARTGAILAAIEAGKHIFTEKPIAETVLDGQKLVPAAQQAGIITGVVHDKLYLPGPGQAQAAGRRRLLRPHPLGPRRVRLLGLRGRRASPPSARPGTTAPRTAAAWSLDMFCHWNYVLESIFGPVETVIAKAVTHIPTRWDEQGKAYAATADDASYGIFELEGGDHRPDQLLLGRPRLPRRAGRVPGRRHPRLRRRRAEQAASPSSAPTPRSRSGTPTCRSTESFRGQWQEVPDNADLDNGFKCAVGGVPARRRRRPAAPLRPRRRRPRRAARRARPAVLRRGPPRRDPGDRA